MTGPTSSPRDDLTWLTTLQGSFARTLDDADPTAPVPSCGRWRVAQLADHLTRVHHWAAAQARRTREAPLGRGRLDQPAAYRACAAELATTLGELDPDARAWTLLDDGVPRSEQSGTVRFWHRRQKLETLVHLWDLRTALGHPDLGLGRLEEPAAVGTGSGAGSQALADLWADCVDEVVTVMHPRQVRLGRVAPPDVEVVLTTGGNERWVLNDAATGTEPGIGTVTVTGDPRSLALLVWGRLPLESEPLTVTGDAAARERLGEVLAAGLTP